MCLLRGYADVTALVGAERFQRERPIHVVRARRVAGASSGEGR